MIDELIIKKRVCYSTKSEKNDISCRQSEILCVADFSQDLMKILWIRGASARCSFGSFFKRRKHGIIGFNHDETLSRVGSVIVFCKSFELSFVFLLLSLYLLCRARCANNLSITVSLWTILFTRCWLVWQFQERMLLFNSWARLQEGYNGMRDGRNDSMFYHGESQVE